MNCLIDDIAKNGEVTSAAEAAGRPAPDFSRGAQRAC